ncbi:hypothetical protein EDD21DRAFT_381514 [Dissophora ornata]|nr:hypothetical protein EDD21DRAFT_381514 [Dissophora ornata]
MMSPGHNSPAMFSPTPTTPLINQQSPLGASSRSGSLDLSSTGNNNLMTSGSQQGSPALASRLGLNSLPGSRSGSVDFSQQRQLQSPKPIPGSNISGISLDTNSNLSSAPSLGNNNTAGVGNNSNTEGSNNNSQSNLVAATGLDDNSSIAAQEDEMLNLDMGLEMEMDMSMGMGDNTSSAEDEMYGNSSNNSHNTNSGGATGGYRDDRNHDNQQSDQDQDQQQLQGLEGLEMDSMINEEDEDDVMNGFLNL